LYHLKLPPGFIGSTLRVARAGRLITAIYQAGNCSFAQREEDHKVSTGGIVGVSEILAHIDREIAQLQQARSLLGGAAAAPTKRPVGRPPKKAAAKKKRNLTPEGRRRIAEAVKRRWAEQKKAASGK
jgi:hypothetical protein